MIKWVIQNELFPISSILVNQEGSDATLVFLFCGRIPMATLSSIRKDADNDRDALLTA